MQYKITVTLKNNDVIESIWMETTDEEISFIMPRLKAIYLDSVLDFLIDLDNEGTTIRTFIPTREIMHVELTVDKL